MDWRQGPSSLECVPLGLLMLRLLVAMHTWEMTRGIQRGRSLWSSESCCLLETSLHPGRQPALLLLLLLLQA